MSKEFVPSHFLIKRIKKNIYGGILIQYFLFIIQRNIGLVNRIGFLSAGKDSFFSLFFVIKISNQSIKKRAVLNSSFFQKADVWLVLNRAHV